MYKNDPDLNDLLSDPLVRLMMASDGVEEAQIRDLAKRIALRHPVDGTRAGGGLSEGGPVLRHTPSCRLGPQGGCSTQPFA